MEIITSEAMGDWSLDWSGCRSPARAMRRFIKGHPQRCRRVYTPRKDAMLLPSGQILMHPVAAAAVRDAWEAFSRKLECDSWRF